MLRLKLIFLKKINTFLNKKHFKLAITIPNILDPTTPPRIKGACSRAMGA
jgi:hypothetical protein